jgi:hypothetical protein
MWTILLLCHLSAGTNVSHKNINQDIQSSSQDLNLEPPEYEVGMLTTRPQLSLKALFVSCSFCVLLIEGLREIIQFNSFIYVLDNSQTRPITAKH